MPFWIIYSLEGPGVICEYIPDPVSYMNVRRVFSNKCAITMKPHGLPVSLYFNHTALIPLTNPKVYFRDRFYRKAITFGNPPSSHVVDYAEFLGPIEETIRNLEKMMTQIDSRQCNQKHGFEERDQELGRGRNFFFEVSDEKGDRLRRFLAPLNG